MILSNEKISEIVNQGGQFLERAKPETKKERKNIIESKTGRKNGRIEVGVSVWIHCTRYETTPCGAANTVDLG